MYIDIQRGAGAGAAAASISDASGLLHLSDVTVVQCERTTHSRITFAEPCAHHNIVIVAP